MDGEEKRVGIGLVTFSQPIELIYILYPQHELNRLIRFDIFQKVKEIKNKKKSNQTHPLLRFFVSLKCHNVEAQWFLSFVETKCHYDGRN